jgi:hypothetical protein
MGGHGAHRNEHNLKETDSEMQGKIQRIELIKHNPNNFHLEFFDTKNMVTILGGAPALAYGALGAAFTYGYYKNQASNMRYNWYLNNTRTAQRLFFGCSVGLFFGYLQFGDRQQLHNAWVAERLRRRYPESMQLHAQDLWSLKGVKTTQEFYRWQ